MENKQDIPELEPYPDREFDLGITLGRRQAFDMFAGQCSVADVECLKTIRERKLFRSTGMDWEEFCTSYAGVTKTHVNRLIRYLDEFGLNYFTLSRMVRISPQAYRKIAGAVSDAGIEVAGETIPIHPENSGRIAVAVAMLRKAAEAAEPEPSETPRQKMERIRKRLESVREDLAALAGVELDADDRILLDAVLGDGLKLLEAMGMSLK